MMKIFRDRERSLLWAGILIVLVVGLCRLWRMCDADPRINFLSEHGMAQWIIYPTPPDAYSIEDAQTSAVFRDKFTLEQMAQKAVLALRAFKQFQVQVNGRPATNQIVASSNWKDASELDVSGLLRPGTNEISITVFNTNAPPALWASLEVGNRSIVTGTNWEASMLGATWRPGWLATIPPRVVNGNALYARTQTTFVSLLQSGPTLLVFAVIACLIVFGGPAIVKKFNENNQDHKTLTPQRLMWVTVIGLAALWVILFCNNLRWLPREYGFDEPAHEAYIDYIRTFKRLPLANQGWEMCQPPLYYIVGAGITWLSGNHLVNDASGTWLRIFGLATAITHFVLIFLVLRLMFPKRPGAQWFGVMLAACVPEHLYISHFITNEFLAAAFVSATLYGCVRLLILSGESDWLAIATGGCLGAALLTKFTSVLAVPFVGGVLAYRIWKKPSQARGAAGRTLGIVCATALIVCGWHYERVWRHFGTPQVYNWDAASGFSWWMYPNFHTSSFFTGFGESLTHPYHSAFKSFCDGIYSTMWGDGYLSGSGSWKNRPAWNYTLMTAGFLLALVPTALILAGLVICAARFLRKPEPVWLLLLGLTLTAYAALFYMSVKMPYYGNVKAFYVLITLLPMCAIGAAGWEWVTNRLPKLRPVLYLSVLVWAMNVFASFWINGGSAATHTMLASDYSRHGKPDAAIAEWKEALRIDPHATTAEISLLSQYVDSGKFDEAMQESKRLLANDVDDDGMGLTQTAWMLSKMGQPRQGLEFAKRAIAIAPDCDPAYQTLAILNDQTGNYSEEASAWREVLRIKPYVPEHHLQLALVLQRVGSNDEADQQLQVAGKLIPGWPGAVAHDKLGAMLAKLNHWELALQQFAEACRLQPDQSRLLNHLAKAKAENGQLQEAIACASHARELSQAIGDSQTAADSAKLVEYCRQIQQQKK